MFTIPLWTFPVIGTILGGVLNRLRGTIAALVWLPGILLAVSTYFATRSFIAAGLVGGGYVFGENWGWNKILWAASEHLTQAEYNTRIMPKDAAPGITPMTNIIAKAMGIKEAFDYVGYCKIQAVIRMLYWWVPVFAPMVYFSICPWWYGVVSVGILSFSFYPIYHFAYGLAGNNAWLGLGYLMRAEIFYGALYGLLIGAAFMF